MLFRIDHHSGVPAYRQLMEQIKLQISLGALKPGDELPSTRALSTEIDLNHMTISKAYSLLEREGLLEHQRGRPLAVAASAGADPSQTRLDALRAALQPVAQLAHQLGISRQEALDLLGDCLDQQS